MSGEVHHQFENNKASSKLVSSTTLGFPKVKEREVTIKAADQMVSFFGKEFLFQHAQNQPAKTVNTRKIFKRLIAPTRQGKQWCFKIGIITRDHAILKFVFGVKYL